MKLVEFMIFLPVLSILMWLPMEPPTDDPSTAPGPHASAGATINTVSGDWGRHFPLNYKVEQDSHGSPDIYGQNDPYIYAAVAGGNTFGFADVHVSCVTSFLWQGGGTPQNLHLGGKLRIHDAAFSQNQYAGSSIQGFGQSGSMCSLAGHDGFIIGPYLHDFETESDIDWNETIDADETVCRLTFDMKATATNHPD